LGNNNLEKKPTEEKRWDFIKRGGVRHGRGKSEAFCERGGGILDLADKRNAVLACREGDGGR